MCQYNFLVTIDKLKTSEIREIITEFELNFDEIKLNIIGYHQLKTFQTTRNQCDCGSVIGINYSNKKSLLPDWKKERKKLEKKGFSSKRIESIIEQKQRKVTDQETGEIKVLQEEFLKWRAFLNDSRLKNKLDCIGVFYHWFSGQFRIEQINIANEKSIFVEQVDIDFIKNIKENEINWIKLKSQWVTPANRQ